MARLITIIGELTRPPTIKDGKDFEKMIGNWLEKEWTLSAEFSQKLDNLTLVALIINMLPKSIQEHVVMNAQESWTKEELLAKVRAIIANKVSGPVPMDIGAAYHQETEQYPDEFCEEGVGAVGMHTQCFTCQGWGHTSRDCPSMGQREGRGQS